MCGVHPKLETVLDETLLKLTYPDITQIDPSVTHKDMLRCYLYRHMIILLHLSVSH